MLQVGQRVKSKKWNSNHLEGTIKEILDFESTIFPSKYQVLVDWDNPIEADIYYLNVYLYDFEVEAI